MEEAIYADIRSLSFSEEGNQVLRDIQLSIGCGEFVVVTGGTGSGKSSLLNCITGAVPKHYGGFFDGTVRLMGVDTADIPLPKMSEYAGYMMQDPQNQIVDTCVYDDIAFGACNLGLPKEEIINRTERMLSFVGLEAFKSRKTETLSGGQAQRMVLAGVLAMEPPILILDQPTAELDPQGRRELYAYLGACNEENNTTILMVMDREDEVLQYADRVLVMRDGMLEGSYPVSEYQINRNKQSESEDVDDILCEAKRIKEPSFRKEIVVLNEVSFSYQGKITGCENISLSLHEGEFTALVGRNGSGKSTLTKLLEGLLFADCGEVRIFDLAMNKKNIRSIRSKTGYLFQDPDLQIFCDTLEEEVGFTLKQQGKIDSEKVRKALSYVGLSEYLHENPQKLSRGQRQLLAFASAIVAEPTLLLADEPTSGLNEEQSRQIMQFLREYADGGKTVLLVTHDLTLAKRFAHRTMAMSEHRIVMDVSAEELNKNESLLARIGLSMPCGEAEV